jgi:hypothetical protein
MIVSWCALLPRRTEDAGRGPLWLDVELYLDNGSAVRAEVEDVFLRPDALG